jgi:surface antigen
MFRPFFVAVPLILAPLALSAPAIAQRGQDCQQRNEGRHRMGGMLGGMARGMLGRVGGAASSVVLPMGSMLGDAIMNLLDCDEQQKAATATEEAVRGGVGTTTSWRSESRPGVTGSSTVTAASNTPAQGECVTVTDVVIVDGQETRAPKHMCRRPPTNRYVRV